MIRPFRAITRPFAGCRLIPNAIPNETFGQTNDIRGSKDGFQIVCPPVERVNREVRPFLTARLILAVAISTYAIDPSADRDE